MDDLTKRLHVVFDELPREGFLAQVWRRVWRRQRRYEDVVLSLNGNILVIKRGVPVWLMPHWLELADRGGFGYEIIYPMI